MHLAVRLDKLAARKGHLFVFIADQDELSQIPAEDLERFDVTQIERLGRHLIVQ